MPELRSWLASSQDPAQVSTTVKGAVLSFSAIIVFVASQVFHIQLTPDNLVALATQVGALAGVVVFFYGLFMKGVVKAGSISRK